VRNKLALLSEQEQASRWSAELCAQWMGANPDQAAVLGFEAQWNENLR
jgi:hypothetical protein